MKSSADKKEQLRKLFKVYKDESKVPIYLESASKAFILSKPLVLVIDPDSSFLYFSKTVSKKLEFMGATNSQSLYFFCQGNQLSNSSLTMGDLFDRYKSPEGWLELRVAGDSPF